MEQPQVQQLDFTATLENDKLKSRVQELSIENDFLKK